MWKKTSIIILTLFIFSCQSKTDENSLLINRLLNKHEVKNIPKDLDYLISVNYNNGVCEDCSYLFSKMLLRKTSFLDNSLKIYYVTNCKDSLGKYVDNRKILESKDILINLSDPISNLSIVKYKNRKVEKIIFLLDNINLFISQADSILSEKK